MRNLIALFLFVSLSLPALGREYSNVVKVENKTEISSHLTGLVIKETEDYYFVVTCQHAMGEKVKGVPFGVEFMSMDGEVRTRCIAEIIKENQGRDLMLLRVKNLEEVEVAPAKLSKDVQYGGMAKVYGFNVNYVINNTYVRPESSQNATTVDGSKMIRCKGPCLQGVSGGPLVKDGAVIGIQSCTDGQEPGCMYIHVEAVRDFLGW